MNVFEAILTFERYFHLNEYREVIVKIHCSLSMQECIFEFDTGCVNVLRIQLSNNEFINGILRGMLEMA